MMKSRDKEISKKKRLFINVVLQKKYADNRFNLNNDNNNRKTLLNLGLFKKRIKPISILKIIN